MRVRRWMRAVWAVAAAAAAVTGGSRAHAQLLLDESVAGAVVHSETVSSNGTTTNALDSSTQVITDALWVGKVFSSETNGATDQVLQYFDTAVVVLEFAAPTTVPDSITSGNVSARLVGVDLQATNSAAMSVEIFDLDDVAEDYAVTAGDFGSAVGSAQATVPDGAFPQEGVDVTDLVRRDLFGDGTGDASIGFVFRPGSSSSGKMLVDVSGAVLEVRRKGADADTASADTETADTTDTGDSASSSADSDTAAEGTASGDSASETATDGRTDGGDTEGRDTNGDPLIDDGEADVSCSCRAVGSRPASLWSVVFTSLW